MEHNIVRFQHQKIGLSYPFYPRVGHRSIRTGKFILMFGGTDQFGEFSNQILSLNLETHQISCIDVKNPLTLEGFSLFLMKEVIYLWGGISSTSVTNELWSFSNSNFMKVLQKGNIPQPRAFHSTNFISNRYLLIFGGWNQTEIFGDWRVLDCESFQWKTVQVSETLPISYGFDTCWWNGRGFLYLTYISHIKGSRNGFYNNKLYEFKIRNFTNFSLSLYPVESEGLDTFNYINSKLALYKDNLFLFGGQNLLSRGQDLSYRIWKMDFNTTKWQILQIKLGVSFGFEILTELGYFFLLGGVQDLQNMSHSYQIIHIQDHYRLSTHICKSCKNSFQLFERHEKFICYNSTQPSIKSNLSSEFIYKLSRLIASSCKALNLLIYYFEGRESEQININLMGLQSQQTFFHKNQTMSYLVVSSRGRIAQEKMLREDFFSFHYRNDNKDQLSEGIMVISALRIGHSFLFVQKLKDGNVFVSYFCYNFNTYEGDDPLMTFAYFTKGNINTPERNIIQQELALIISESQYLNLGDHNERIYIFNFQQKIDRKKHDIVFPQYYHTFDYNFSSYLKRAYLKPLKFKMKVNNIEISFNDIFKKKEHGGEDIVFSPNSIIKRYRIQSNVKQGNHAFVYYKNRLLFYHSLKRSFTIFVQLADHVSINVFHSMIEKLDEKIGLKNWLSNWGAPIDDKSEDPYQSTLQ